MAPSTSTFAATALLLASTANAHFLLQYPPTIGFDDDSEPTAPCGSFTPDFATDNVTDFHVGGDSISTKLLHPQGTWLYRGTLDQTASGNWTQLFPEVMQSGLGDFCEPAVTAPASWAGKKGVISVAVDAPDGVLFQCAAVNFIAGAADITQSVCLNSTGVTGSFTTDANLAPLLDSNSTAAATTSSSTATSATASASKNAAPGRVSGPLHLGSAAAAVVAIMFGSTYMML